MLEILSPVVRGVNFSGQGGSLWTLKNILLLPFLDFYSPTTPHFLTYTWKKKKKKNTRLSLRCNCVRVPIDLAV